MSVLTRPEFITRQASDKLTLAHVDGRARLYVFNSPVSQIYSKTVPYFVQALQQDETDLSKVNSIAEIVSPGQFYYDIKTSVLYARFYSDADPQTVEVITTYRFFFSTKGIQTSHNLENIAEEVDYKGRIVSSPGYKHKIGIDQALTSLVGEGTLKLKNEDGGLDNVFDTLIFENQDVTIYSWNEDLTPSDSKVIYRGRVTNKTYDGNTVSFKIKDQIFSLLDAPSLDPYDNNDSVAESVKGQYKRRVYGRVDGLQAQATDQVADGFSLTGTGTMVANSTTMTGSGTQFLSEVVQNDTIIVGTQEFTVESVDSDTQLTMSDESSFAFAGQALLSRPERGTTLKNRTFLAAGHICATVTHTVADVKQFNRVILDSTDGLFAGDFIEFTSSGERIEIKNVAPGNVVVLTQNVVTKPTIGSTAVRQPVQEVYIEGVRAQATDFAVFNNSTGCGITFNNQAEFNLSRPKNTVFTATFTNSNRNVTVSTTEVSLADVFQPGDFIKPNLDSFSTYYKITHITDTEIFLSVPFAETTNTDTIEIRSPQYLNDESTVSVNILGRTVDGTAAGQWIQTAAEASRDMLKDLNISAVNEPSFVEGATDATQLVSMAIPFDFNSKSLPTVKDLVDALNKSVHSSLTLDNDLKIQYRVLNVYTGEDLKVIRDSDVIDWKIKTTNGKTYKTALARYRFTDVDISTVERGNSFVSFESQFVTRYIKTNKADEIDLYLYEERDAEIAAHRHLYYNSLSVATMMITTDLRLENVEIGDVVIADFRRLYRRKGDNVRKKAMLVIGKTVTGQKTTLELSDLGNAFNTSAYITPNDAPCYEDATEDQKLIYGFITDNQGIVDDKEDTAGINLIS